MARRRLAQGMDRWARSSPAHFQTRLLHWARFDGSILESKGLAITLVGPCPCLPLQTPEWMDSNLGHSTSEKVRPQHGHLLILGNHLDVWPASSSQDHPMHEESTQEGDPVGFYIPKCQHLLAQTGLGKGAKFYPWMMLLCWWWLMTNDVESQFIHPGTHCALTGCWERDFQEHVWDFPFN